MPDLHTPQKFHELPLSIVKNMIMLSTSGFGVVVGLAWNSFIQKAVEEYVNPYFGKDSGVFSMFAYAALMTVLAVAVTMQLASLQRKLEPPVEKKSV